LVLYLRLDPSKFNVRDVQVSMRCEQSAYRVAQPPHPRGVTLNNRSISVSINHQAWQTVPLGVDHTESRSVRIFEKPKPLAERRCLVDPLREKLLFILDRLERKHPHRYPASTPVTTSQEGPVLGEHIDQSTALRGPFTLEHRAGENPGMPTPYRYLSTLT
jgi:hypothetical protein